jgi:hypothetical protein
MQALFSSLISLYNSTSPYPCSEEYEPAQVFTAGANSCFVAALNGDLETLKRYVESGGDLQVREPAVGYTLLHSAARGGQV